MSEERSDLTAGPAPGKRPLDHSADLTADPDDSSLAPKRLKVADGLGKEDTPTPHNAISNGELDSPAQDGSPTSNGEDKHDGEDNKSNQPEPEPQPKYVAEAEAKAEPETQQEANGDGNSIPSVESNSGESAPCISSSERSEEKGEETDQKSTVDSMCDKSGDHQSSSDHHKEKSNSPNVSDVDTSRTDNSDNSGSCNGEAKAEHESEPQVATADGDQKHEGKDDACGEESDSEAMDVDVENDSTGSGVDEKLNEKSVGTSVEKLVENLDEKLDEKSVGTSVEKLVEKLVGKSDEVETSEIRNVTDTSVPKDSSGAESKHVDSDKTEESSMDKEEGSTGPSHDPEDMPQETDLESNAKSKESGTLEETPLDKAASSEKETVPDSTSDSKDAEDDFKENKIDLYVDCLHLLSEEQQEARFVIMKRLHEELRNEETKLLLLKKLRLNQQQPVSVPTKPEGAPATAAVNGAAPAPAAPAVNAHGHRTGIGMNTSHSSVAGGKPHASIQPQSNSSSHRPDMPQLMHGSHIQRQLLNYQKGHSGPPPLIMAQSNRSLTSTSSSQSSQMVRAPVVRITSSAPASSTSTSSISRQMQHQQQQQQQQQHQHQQQQQQSSSRQSQMANDGQSAASRQAAAKLALRKQLEKTLLQIPPPKPPPPELHFLPSAANNEFIILVGLEEVVNTILDFDKHDKNQSKGFLQPFKCAQCNTDFTTIWKQVKMDPKQGIMCESCIVSNQKKALKAEHTNRLKTAFVKALQQEQEIEQRIQQSQQSTPQQQQSVSRVSGNVQRHRPPQVVHRSHSGSMHHSSSQQHKQRVMNPAPSQRVVQPIHYAYIPNLPVSAPQIQIIPKQHMMVAHRSSADRQREYLLDMIPSKGLGHPQNPVIWKR